MTIPVVFAALGSKALLLLYVWLASAAISAELSRSKGYGEKPGLGTGLLLSALGPIIWFFVPPKDDLAEWHTRKPWQRRKKPRESEMASAMAGDSPQRTAQSEPATATQADEQSGSAASDVDESGGAGSRPGESRDSGGQSA